MYNTCSVRLHEIKKCPRSYMYLHVHTVTKGGHLLTDHVIGGLVTCRLEGEARVEKVIKRVQEYLEKRQSGADSTVLCRIYIRRIEHLYYKVCMTVCMCVTIVSQVITHVHVGQ